MRTAVFITPESLLNHVGSTAPSESLRGAAIFQLASHTVSAIDRLKEAGFMIIGLGRDELFRGFASKTSCSAFLAAAALDDVIIPHANGKESRCATAMIQAAAKWLLDLDRSYFVSLNEDDMSDAELTGCTPLRISTGKKRSVANESGNGLPEVVDRILALNMASELQF